MRGILVVVVLGLAACGGSTETTATAPGSSADLPILAVQRPLPPDAVWPQPLPVGDLMVSPGNCLALGDPNTILYAPDGSTVSSDGGGFTLDGREFRLGEPIKGGFSGLLLPFEDVPDPSPVLIDCNPEKVVILFQEADDAVWG